MMKFFSKTCNKLIEKMYPFITQNKSKKGYYFLEGIYILEY